MEKKTLVREVNLGLEFGLELELEGEREMRVVGMEVMAVEKERELRDDES